MTRSANLGMLAVVLAILTGPMQLSVVQAGEFGSAQRFVSNGFLPGKICLSRVFKGQATRNSRQQAIRIAVLDWANSVRRDQGTGFSSWYRSSGKDIRCRFDVGQQRHSCSAFAKPCLLGNG